MKPDRFIVGEVDVPLFVDKNGASRKGFRKMKKKHAHDGKAIIGFADEMNKDLDVIIGACQKSSAFYVGDLDAVVPPEELLLSTQTNPDFNGCRLHIVGFFDEAKKIPCGDPVYRKVAPVFSKTIDCINELISIKPFVELIKSKTAVKEAADYFPCDYYRKLPLTIHAENCEKLKQKWIDCFHNHSYVYFEIGNKEMERRRGVVEERIVQSNEVSFPAIHISGPVGHIVDVCDRNRGIIGIKGVGKFYVGPMNTIAWKVLVRLIESCDEHGFANLSDLTPWRCAFVSANVAKVPREYELLGVKGANELSKLIVSEGRSGRFRLKRCI